MATITTDKNTLPKQKDFAFGKDVYLLGTDKDGIQYWLEAASWDCEWYWGFGYVETYYKNRQPSKAKDIDSHQHIDSSFIGKIDCYKEYVHNLFDCPTLVNTTFSESEGWTLTELFKTFYLLKETAQMYHTGGTHTANNPLRASLINKEEENRINKVLLPAVFAEIYKILSPSTDK